MELLFLAVTNSGELHLFFDQQQPIVQLQSHLRVLALHNSQFHLDSSARLDPSLAVQFAEPQTCSCGGHEHARVEAVCNGLGFGFWEDILWRVTQRLLRRESTISDFRFLVKLIPCCLLNFDFSTLNSSRSRIFFAVNSCFGASLGEL